MTRLNTRKKTSQAKKCKIIKDEMKCKRNETKQRDAFDDDDSNDQNGNNDDDEEESTSEFY